jgi:GT2 family glycosyltransferase
MMEDHRLDSPHPVDWVFGACMVVPREYFQSIDGMDQRFRLYYEDVDLCLRIWKSGREVWFYPGTAFFHEHLRTSAKRPFSRTWRWHLRSACRYFLKHHYFFRPRRFAPTRCAASGIPDPRQAGPV